MKLAFQGKNNGKVTLTADNLKFACTELGIPDDSHTLRRAARAFDLYYSGKVEHINDHSFTVESQYNRQRPYQVTLHEGATKTYGYCTCQDWMNYSGDMDVPNVDFWCKHMISAALWLHKNCNGNGTRVVNDCGTEEARILQEKLNGNNSNCQPKNDNDNGNGADKAPPQQLDINDPFQECEQLDIDQVEGRGSGELVHKLSNGEYVVSYKGIMKLAEKHDITFSLMTHDDTNTVIAKARQKGYATGNAQRRPGERISGKPINVSVQAGLSPQMTIRTAGELAMRNAARQLLPFAEIKALELKARLEADFSWETAKAKCVELVLTLANVDITIHELVKAGKLRQDNPSHYNRIEWLIIHNACKKDREQSDDNDGGDNSPPSPREISNETLRDKQNPIPYLTGSSEARDPKSLNRWSYRPVWRYRTSLNSDAFIEKCREAIDKVREKKKVEANDQPISGGNGKRKLQMDSKLRTWLIETDGTKKSISCREICEKFESNIVTRLRAGIDSGADISTVELDD